MFGSRSGNSADALRVLHVEDEAMARKFVKGLLKDGDYDVTQVASLTSGMFEVMKKEYDVAILDLNTGDSDGFSTLSEFRERFPGLPVVVLTGTSGDLEAQAEELGAEGLLKKNGLDASALHSALTTAAGKATA